MLDSNSYGEGLVPGIREEGEIPNNWTAEDLLEWMKLEDRIAPALVKLLPYGKFPGLTYQGLYDYEELMFLYINRDIWE